MSKLINELSAIQLAIATPKEILLWTKKDGQEVDENAPLEQIEAALIENEITKPETINYKSFKPEPSGLFDEKIFGPVKDFRCSNCGKKHKKADEGKLCTNCAKTIIQSSVVRRRNMGFIKLAAPIAHIWFTKVNYSTIAPILDLSQNQLESIIYFKSHIVISNVVSLGKETKVELKNIITPKQIIDNNEGPKIYFDILKKVIKIVEDHNKTAKSPEDLRLSLAKEKLAELEDILRPNHIDKDKLSRHEVAVEYGIDFYEYNDFLKEFFGVTIETGAEAIRALLATSEWYKDIGHGEKELRPPMLNLLKEKKRHEIDLSKKSTDDTKILRKIKIIESFIKSGQAPENMILTHLPVLPPDMRPLIQLDGGRHSSSDINELYRRIVIRNERLKNWIQMEAPTIVIQNEKRMLQDAVDALFDNERRQQSKSKDGRTLVSIAENLKGKQGRFRKNLLGKRVDYSGRSVIVVGPELTINQCGLPKEMVIKLFEPFIINLLVKEEGVPNVKKAKKMIEEREQIIWKYAEKAIQGRPVLLNRAPTLHRLSVQAFQPIIVRGNAIRLHPLVTTPFNADFDGDQMAVHVPLSLKAKQEAFELMQPHKNILGPKDGSLIIQPSQDFVLGPYYLTKVKAENNIKMFASIEEMKAALDLKIVHVHDLIILSTRAINEKINVEVYPYVITTVGRTLLNEVFPKSYPYIHNVNDENLKESQVKFFVKKGQNVKEAFDKLDRKLLLPIKKKDAAKLIENIFEGFPAQIAFVLDEYKKLAVQYSTQSGTSVSFGDIITVEKAKEISDADAKVKKLQAQYEEGDITDDQRYSKVLEIWGDAKKVIQDRLAKELERSVDNSLYMMMDSGARGNISNFVQLSGLRGIISKPTQIYQRHRAHNILVRNEEEIPIKSSFRSGLNVYEFYLSTHGARKALSDTALKTAESGYLTRRLVDAIQDVFIKEEDCHTTKGMDVGEIKDIAGQVQEPFYDRLVGRYINQDFESKGVSLKANELITSDIAKAIAASGVEKVNIRSIIKCETFRGICKKCYGIDLATRQDVAIGEAVGIISSQSIGEPGTQLTMRTFHTGGVAGVSDITQGFHRLLELLDANKLKSPALISPIEGTIESISNESEKYKVVISNSKIKEKISLETVVQPFRNLKVGSKIKRGEKLTAGSVQLEDLLRFAGVEELQQYIISEIQTLYRAQGINIADKYIEVITRQMLSKVIIIDNGDSELFAGQIVSQDFLRDVNRKLFAKGKRPAIGKVQIFGVKVLPIYSESFLAAASYQRTAESLVKAAINKGVDHLIGVKENVILGKRIPIGTGFANPDGKYNIEWEIEREEDIEEEVEIEFATASLETNTFEIPLDHSWKEGEIE